MSEDPWEPRALCLDQPELFELGDWPDIEPSHPHFQSQIEDWVNMERRKFRKSENVCLECPVFVQCGKTADKNDKQWTMRAGVEPAILTATEKYPAYACLSKSSHDQAADLPYCMKCLRMGRTEREKERAAKRAARAVLN